MKKISFLFTVIIFILSGNRASAQTELQSATLQQGDKTSIYYGKDAFISAFNAVTGVTDVVSLSSGTFNSPTFNKACARSMAQDAKPMKVREYIPQMSER
ncbi:MAG: hypothetical protein ACLUE2_17020 [Bacteroides cellulosilyticus]